MLTLYNIQLVPIFLYFYCELRIYPSLFFHSDILTEADLDTLVNLLEEVAHKWDAVCLQLGVPMSKIKNIQANLQLLSGGPRAYFQNGLFEWLYSSSPEHPCTISNLCSALKVPSVDEEVLANRVEMMLKSRG